MPAYVISERMVEHDNPASLEAYRAVAGKLVADNGGVYLAMSRDNRALSDHAVPLVATIIRFPSMQHVENWWNSPEYRAIAHLWKNTPMRSYAIEGTIPAHAVNADNPEA